ncbi:tRNA (adenosine(37)-N6)-threonylcarbamoyltransferase complex transferase subunit TsaD [Acidaminobacter hydrogenoformans]|uniref:N(6)-L-threonylcarbamoyladenine synthase n=1 Tax=Acidaminobacter hydrogenoformans DSM 2784 TaxID=1120920 RepID=A0A1G5S818_9FIRM|nr:hypothetical protein [Acidaminobacter hydrogenoformans]SCZ82040.1 N6-L-threonylcarbamoyladenine synthase [Acidaminobacter hydrogenoformans DSM 2784]
MKAKSAFLGIDTSAYTTSVAVVDEDGVCLSDARRLLEIKTGERGLRQSEAFFQHVNHLPERLEQALMDASRPQLSAIAVSRAPRDVEGSYMPVFQAGVRIAESLSITLGIPLYRTTHQDGHLMAGCQSHPVLLERPFLAVHLSGGTTEILVCRYVGKGFQAKLVGGSKDLSFGQLIDRVGVRLGLPFPAGKAMEALILEGETAENVVFKPSVFPKVRPSAWFNLSGLENKAYSLLEAGETPAQVAAGLMDCLSRTLMEALRCVQSTLDCGDIKDVLIIGGVASNLRLRADLEQGLRKMKPCPLNARYASVAASSDNAIGVALIAKACYQQGETE